MCADSLYGEFFRGGKVDRQSGRFSPRGWQEKSVQMARLGRNIHFTVKNERFSNLLIEKTFRITYNSIELLWGGISVGRQTSEN
jgi:hypothetical protein